MEAQEGDQPALYAIAWETREGTLSQRELRTIKQVLFCPRRSFASPLGKEFGPALTFGILIGFFGFMADFIWDFIFDPYGWGARLMFLLIAPLIVGFSLLAGAFVLHFFLWLLRGASQDMGTTLKVVAYCHAAYAFALIPVIGVYVGAAWGLVVLTLGLAAANRISLVRAALAVAAPAGLAAWVIY